MVVHDPAVVDVVGPRRRHRQPARRRRPHPRGQPRGACRGDPTLGCLPRTGVASVNLSLKKDRRKEGNAPLTIPATVLGGGGGAPAQRGGAAQRCAPGGLLRIQPRGPACRARTHAPRPQPPEPSHHRVWV